MADRPRLSIAISIEDPNWARLAPDAARVLRRAARDALAQAKADGWKGSRVGHEISFVLTDDKRMRALNGAYRGKDRPTNVLSFAALDAAKPGAAKRDAAKRDAGGPKSGMPWLLGDVVFASGVIAREAKAQHKSLTHHLTHLAVHGVLHLLGYDHEQDRDAETMEALEVAALARMGIANPYELHR
jgi:probable rRNA maturation factor